MLLLSTTQVPAGPIILSGMDPEDHGQPGWDMIRDIMEFVVSNSTIYIAQGRPAPTRVLQLGGVGGPIGFSSIDAGAIAATLNYTMTIKSGDAILSVPFADYDAIYMPTASQDLLPAFGGVSSEDLVRINQRALEIIQFINAGGGLAAFSQNAPGGYGWFPLGGLITQDLGLPGGQGIAVTPEGIPILSPSATAVQPFHTAFIGPPGFFGLQVLATENTGTFRALIIGGDGSTCVGPFLVLSPPSGSASQCQAQSITATAMQDAQPCGPLANVAVTFSILTGPNGGGGAVVTTDANGIATFDYSGTGGSGMDVIRASFVSPQTFQTIVSNDVTRNWTAGAPPAIGDAGPIQLTVAKNSNCGTPANLVALTATDPGGDPSVLAWTISTPPATGTASFIGGAAGGTVTVCYAPNPGQQSADAFTIRVDNPCGGSDTVGVQVIVQNSAPSILNADPVALTVQKNSACPLPANSVVLSAVDSDDPPADLTWSLATPPATGSVSFPGGTTGASITACYTPNPNQIAPDSFVVRVSDDAGGSDTALVQVTVVNAAPVIAGPNPVQLTVQKNTACPLPANTVMLSADDPDADEALLAWSLMTPPSTGVVSFPTGQNGGTIAACYQPFANQIAPDSFVIRVSDGRGGDDTVTIQVTVVNSPPNITQGGGPLVLPVAQNSTCPGIPNQVGLSATDPDGPVNLLQWSVTTLPATGLVTFVTPPSGAATTVCYRPNPNQTAADSFVVTVVDDCGGTDAIQINVTIDNQPPNILNAEPVSITVQKNSTCPAASNQVQLSATDPDAPVGLLAWSISSGPGTGQASFVGGTSGGTVTVCYQPNANQKAADSFQVMVADAHGGTDSVVVNVTIVNDPPVIQQGAGAALSVASNSDCSSPANHLVLNAVDPDEDESFLAWSIPSAPAHGAATFVGAPTGGAVDICYQPGPGNATSDSFTVLVDDGCGGTDSIGVTVTITPASTPTNVSQRGSLFVLPEVVVAWTATAGPLPIVRTDTIISIVNDASSTGVLVKLYFVNGASPIPPWGPGQGTVEPGWNYMDNVIQLTHDESAWWSAFTGRAGGTPVTSRFPILDNDGRLDPDGAGPADRILRGFIIGFAVDAQGRLLRHNALTAAAAIVDYVANEVREYPAWIFQANFPTVLQSDTILLDGSPTGYDTCPEFLVFDLFAVGSTAAGADVAGRIGAIDTAVTIVPMIHDFSPTHPLQAPMFDAQIDVWNEDEVKLTNQHRCIQCWDSTRLADYHLHTHLPWVTGGIINHFHLQNLGSHKAKARFKGRAFNLCERPPNPNASPPDPGLASVSMPILGTRQQVISWGGVRITRTASTPSGAGERADGRIKFVPVVDPPEAATP